MITPKGKLIEINNSIEWLLYERIIQKTNPIKLLKTTDSIIQIPNFLFALTLLIMCLVELDTWIKLILPFCLYLAGQILVNLKLNLSSILIIPASIYSMASNVFMMATFITTFFYFKWYISLLFIPIYFIAMIFSISIMTLKDKKFYRENYGIKTGSFEIFKNNAFLSAYKHTAKKLGITTSLTPTMEEINNIYVKYHYTYMRENWNELKDNFNDKAQYLWRAYLFPEN